MIPEERGHWHLRRCGVCDRPIFIRYDPALPAPHKDQTCPGCLTWFVKYVTRRSDV